MNAHRGKILYLPPNRVWRTYSGGQMLDRLEGRESPEDGAFPEDWIGSTVLAINPNRAQKNEGLSRVTFSGSEALLADLIASDPEYFLGLQHLSRFGANPMILVKYLDSAVRLPFQVHPTSDFSRRYLNSDCGKTEAYCILSTRPEVEEPYIYLGFQRPPSRTDLQRMIVEQDITSMELCFDKLAVKPGDVYVVPGGLPHAIGNGVLMVEIMEPTDFVARLEFNVAGRVVPKPSRFMGRDVDFALDMLSFEPMPANAVQSRWRCESRTLEKSARLHQEALVDGRVTDRFNVLRTTLSGRSRWYSKGFTILLIVEGSCAIAAADQSFQLKQLDRIVVPHGMDFLEINAPNRVTFLECLPPGTL